jgi:hypothetical protein
MNARLVKLAFTLCLISLLNLAGILHAQDTNTEEVPPPPGYANGGGPQQPGRRGGTGVGPMGNAQVLPMFDIQIENGQLSLAPLKDQTEIKKIWGTGVSSVPATIDNITKYLRAVDPQLNVILSPEVGPVTIYNLKLNTRLLGSISDAISVASGGAIRGNGAGRGGGGGGEFFGGGARGERGLTFAASNSESHPAIEVFNLSGYIQTLGKMNEDGVRQKLDDLEGLITETLKDLHVTKSSADLPNFKYHAGTKLLIVTGKPETIDVTRKIVNALSGQQTYGRTDLLDVTVPSEQK